MSLRNPRTLLLCLVIGATLVGGLRFWRSQAAESSVEQNQIKAPLPAFAVTPKAWAPIVADTQLDISEVNASAAILIDVNSNQVLAEREAHQRRPMASLTKVMTAALVLEFTQPGSIITIPAEAMADLPGDSAVMGISKGEKYTIKELLYGLLLPSGNDAAQALAIAVAGNQARFVELMNAKAAQLGMRDTHFDNPSGLDSPTHYSTPYDLAILTHYAQTFDLFNEVVGTAEKLLAYSENHKYLDLVNANPFISMYPGATGVKPGTTGNAGNCLIASATQNGRTFIGVLLNTPGRNTNMIKLFNLGYNSR